MPPKKNANGANTFDLDLEDSDPEPFVVKLGNREYELLDIAQVDYRVAADLVRSAAAGDLQQVVRAIVRPSDWDAFSKHSLTVRQLTALFTAYSKYYSLTV